MAASWESKQRLSENLRVVTEPKSCQK